jgi:hypothetical protein
MQTFLPSPDFNQSADQLDSVRRWKQVVEARQLIAILKRDTKRWKNPNAWLNHPAVLMWQGYLNALKYYHNCFIQSVVRHKTHDLSKCWYLYPIDGNTPQDQLNIKMPWWLHNKSFHASHRSNLLRKDEKFYRQWGWTEPLDLEYVWPSKVVSCLFE